MEIINLVLHCSEEPRGNGRDGKPALYPYDVHQLPTGEYRLK